ncbi:unnamed protein product [Echinostoma caproni]|uniref:Integrase_H2C2 domain-containing protein n=1 Tax=Echinostoma caproni TaxID=27848 RepID=A0A182ZZW2_9TREM|nr:unnamed protein product [Echinostoma caproni]
MAGSSYFAKRLWALWPSSRLVNLVLMYQDGSVYTRRTTVPPTAVNTVLKPLHEELGHADQKKLAEVAKQHFWWMHMRRDVALLCN